MMQQIAAKKTDIASNVQIGLATGSSEQQYNNSKGQDFASMLERSRADEVNAQAQRNHNVREKDANPAVTKHEVNQSQQQTSKASEPAEPNNNAQSGNKAEEQVAKKDSASESQASESQEAQATESDTAKAEQQSASDEHSETTQDEQSQAAAEEKADEELAQEEAVHFDWLAMLDKLHGQASDQKEVGDSVKADEVVETDMQSELDKLLQGQFGNVEKETSDDIEMTTDLPSDEVDVSDESLQDILAMIDALSEKDQVSEEELLKLDAMIDEFMAQNPELKDSPLKELTGKDWLQVDPKLFTQMMNTNVKPQQEQIAQTEQKLEEPLLQKLAVADKEQVQKVVEHIANQVMPKEVQTSQASQIKETFVDKLKAGVEEMKSQLQQGHQPAINLGQMVKDAMAAATDGSNAIDQAKLQQVLATTNSTMDVAAQLTESKVAGQEALKPGIVSNGKESSVAQLEAARQQTANQLERTVNMNKPDAPQNLADKVQLMVNQKNMTADIRLDPPGLGDMKIKVNMSGDAASVNFVVQTQQAREALEHAAPRLKELLDEQGIELGQSSVEQESKQHDAENAGGQFAGGSGGENAEPEEEIVEQQPIRVVNGAVNGIDYFA